MVNLVQEVKRAKMLQEEVYFDKPRYGLIDIMREHRPIYVKREGMNLPAIASEVLPSETRVRQDFKVFSKQGHVAATSRGDYVSFRRLYELASVGRTSALAFKRALVHLNVLQPQGGGILSSFGYYELDITLVASRDKLILRGGEIAPFMSNYTIYFHESLIQLIRAELNK